MQVIRPKDDRSSGIYRQKQAFELFVQSGLNLKPSSKLIDLDLRFKLTNFSSAARRLNH